MPSPRTSEARRFVGVLCAGLLAVQGGCAREPVPPDEKQIARAESILDAFYSWDSAALASVLESTDGAAAMRYYQLWADAAHYEILERRPCVQTASFEVVCAVTVTDDFGAALGYTATDSFTFEFDADLPTRVEFEGDDPVIFTALFVWMSVYRGDVFEDACEDMFAGGETPADCARAVADAAQAFADWIPFD